MKIKYRIIWFEDEKSWLKSAVPFVEENLIDKGFEPVIESYQSAKKITKLLWNKINRSDLIVMDLNLGVGLKGNDLIKKVRVNNVLTEVIFYSNAGEDALRKLVHDEKLDGIYCSERGSCWKKINEVVSMNIQKAQDVNALRGLVMAEESELQNLTAQILWNLHKNNHTLASFVRENAHKQTNKHVKEAMEWLVELKPEKHYKKLFENNMIYNARAKQISLSTFLNKIVKTKDIFKSVQSVMKKYDNEVISPRNILAHSVEKEIRGRIFLVHKKNGKTEFTETECIKIRKNLQKHRENLKTILELVQKDGKNVIAKTSSRQKKGAKRKR